MKKSRKGASRTNVGALIFGIVLTAIMLFGGALIAAMILKSTGNPTSGIGACAPALLFVTAACASFATVKYKGEGGTLPAALSSLLCAVVMLLVGLVMTKGHLPLVGAVNFGAYAVIGVTVAVLARSRKKFRNGRK